MDKNRVKAIALELGADLCRIAPVSRFNQAPEGFRPTEISSNCKSVVVFAKSLPTGAIFAKSCVPYTHINNVLQNSGHYPQEKIIIGDIPWKLRHRKFGNAFILKVSCHYDKIFYHQ